MVNGKGDESNDSQDNWVSEYKGRLRRGYLEELNRAREAKEREGFLLHLGQWRTIEEIVEWSILERRRKNAVLADLLVLLVILLVASFGAVYALFRWYR